MKNGSKRFPFRTSKLRLHEVVDVDPPHQTWRVTYPLDDGAEIAFTLSLDMEHDAAICRLLSPRFDTGFSYDNGRLEIVIAQEDLVRMTLPRKFLMEIGLPENPQDRARFLLKQLAQREAGIPPSCGRGSVEELKQLLQDVADISRISFSAFTATPDDPCIMNHQPCEAAPSVRGAIVPEFVTTILEWHRPTGLINCTSYVFDANYGADLGDFIAGKISAHDKFLAIGRLRAFLERAHATGDIPESAIGDYLAEIGIDID